MPTNRRRLGPRSLTALTLAQQSYLRCGIYFFDTNGENDHFASDEEPDAAWDQHRERILGEWNRPGQRPPLLWQLDVGLECIRWPDQWQWPKPYQTETDLVRALILAGELESCRLDGANRIRDEVEVIEADWRHRLYVAVQHTHGRAVEPFDLLREVPHWYYDQHVADMKVRVAAERAAWKRSIASHIRTPAPAG